MLLQERDPRSYQILVQQPSGACFLGSTPEQLYIRTGSAVASEAVAATRPRGPPGHTHTLPTFASHALLLYRAALWFTPVLPSVVVHSLFLVGL